MSGQPKCDLAKCAHVADLERENEGLRKTLREALAWIVAHPDGETEKRLVKRAKAQGVGE